MPGCRLSEKNNKDFCLAASGLKSALPNTASLMAALAGRCQFKQKQQQIEVHFLIFFLILDLNNCRNKYLKNTKPINQVLVYPKKKDTAVQKL